MKTSASRFNAK